MSLPRDMQLDDPREVARAEDARAERERLVTCQRCSEHDVEPVEVVDTDGERMIVCHWCGEAIRLGAEGERLRPGLGEHVIALADGCVTDETRVALWTAASAMDERDSGRLCDLAEEAARVQSDAAAGDAAEALAEWVRVVLPHLRRLPSETVAAVASL